MTKSPVHTTAAVTAKSGPRVALALLGIALGMIGLSLLLHRQFSEEETGEEGSTPAPVPQSKATPYPSAPVTPVDPAALPKPAGPGGTWASYRGGPTQQGVAEGRLPGSLKVRWTMKTEEAIEGSAVIAGGRAFVGSKDHHVYAVDMTTGAVAWKVETGAGVEAAPLVADGTVFVGSSDKVFYALAAADGKRLWSFTTGDKILAAATAVPAPAGVLPPAQPAAGADGSAEGRPDSDLWVLVGSYDARMYCLNAGSGRLIWTYETGNFVNGAAAVDEGRVVFGGCDKFVHAVALKDGAGLFKVDLGEPVANTAAIFGGSVYVGHYGNVFVSIDLAAGKVAWTYKDQAFPFFSSPAVTAEVAVFGARDKKVHCVDRMTGLRKWTFATQGRVDSSPVICGDKVVVGSSDGRLYGLNLADGKELFSVEIGADLLASPAVAGGWVVIGAQDGVLYGLSGE